VSWRRWPPVSGNDQEHDKEDTSTGAPYAAGGFPSEDDGDNDEGSSPLRSVQQQQAAINQKLRAELAKLQKQLRASGCSVHDADGDPVAIAQHGVGRMVQSRLQEQRRPSVTNTVQQMVGAMIGWISSTPTVGAGNAGDARGSELPGSPPSVQQQQQQQQQPSALSSALKSIVSSSSSRRSNVLKEPPSLAHRYRATTPSRGEVHYSNSVPAGFAPPPHCGSCNGLGQTATVGRRSCLPRGYRAASGDLASGAVHT
jgi:hypothetical protein